jgi:outer membrane lipoprotein-sorting protein
MKSARRVLSRTLAALLLFLPFPASAAESTEMIAALSPDDVANVVRVEQYLNRIDTIQARFVQISSNGGFAEGEVFVHRPGNLRFDYDPPATALLIANGTTLLYYDKELKQASFIPLWETPLWFLVREKVTLQDGLEVISVKEDLGTISVTLRETEAPDNGEVTLIFSDSPIALKKWEVLDAQGILTQVSLINPQYGVAIDKAVFDYGDLEINKGQRRIEIE